MLTNHGLMRIFWPLDAPLTNSPGVIIGWRNSSQDVFVLAILEDVEPRSVDNALRVGALYRNCKYSMTRMFQLCGRSSVHVLGLTNPSMPFASSNPAYIYAYTRHSSRFPAISCPNDVGDITVQVIMFKRPNPTQMQYLSLEPMPLALGDKTERVERNISTYSSTDIGERTGSVHNTALINKLRLHSVIRHPPSQKELCLPDILGQANCSMEMGRLLQLNIGLVRSRQRRTLSVGERVVNSATSLWDHVTNRLWSVLVVWLYPIITRVFVTGLICHRVVAEIILSVLEWRLRPDYAALKDVSATAQQVDIRLQQFCYWPIQYLTLRKRKNDWESVTDSHPDYIRFYNSLWLVANDVMIGISIGSYIIDNAGWVAFQIDYVLSGWTVEGLRRTILWLMDWPAGLKLNKELADFLGDLFLWVIDYWRGS
ncbi:MAG: phosphatidylinositol N-acetylglucosaminyltransferase subunit gpi1 [Candelina submexicana]|nr:MAG: phosphatidylinositol N-acetylglucosaminyltransferase subunit gpi1 [Candelina submexicana]